MLSPIKDATTLGQLVRHVRKQHKLTQPDVALAAGVGLRFLNELEAGKPTLRLALVLRVLDVLGITLQAEAATPSGEEGV